MGMLRCMWRARRHVSQSPKLTNFPRQPYRQTLVLKLTEASFLLHCKQGSPVSSGTSLSAFPGASQHHLSYSVVVQCLKHTFLSSAFLRVEYHSYELDARPCSNNTAYYPAITKPVKCKAQGWVQMCSKRRTTPCCCVLGCIQGLLIFLRTGPNPPSFCWDPLPAPWKQLHSIAMPSPPGGREWLPGSRSSA